MKKHPAIVMLLMVALIITSCGNNGSVSENVSANNIQNEVNEADALSADEISVSDMAAGLEEEGDAMPPAKVYSVSGNMEAKLSKFDQLEYYNEETATIIQCVEGAVSVNGQGAVVNGSRITLLEQGTYIIKGDYPDNSFFINTASDNKIHLVLDGANINCNTTSPVYGAYGDKIIITLAENTENSLSDTVNHANDGGNGCLYSRTDVTINGAGTLNITANYSNGIAVKKNLKIYGSNVNITAANNGIKGNNSVSLIDSKVSVSVNGDGIKVSETEDKSKGFIFISGGITEITADDDVFQTINAFVMKDNADVRGRCYGSLVNCYDGYIEGAENIKTWE